MEYERPIPAEKDATPNPVIAFKEDVKAWVYFDQVDQVLRYEAYVIGYDEGGEPTTLSFVFEEGVLRPDILDVPDDISELLSDMGDQSGDDEEEIDEIDVADIADLWLTGNVVLRKEAIRSPSRNMYLRSLPAEVGRLHRFFAQQESLLKKRNRKVWCRKLRALGYDVIPSAGGR